MLLSQGVEFQAPLSMCTSMTHGFMGMRLHVYDSPGVGTEMREKSTLDVVHKLQGVLQEYELDALITCVPMGDCA